MDISQYLERLYYRLAFIRRDLIAIIVILFLTDISILAPIINRTPLRIPFGFLILLFLPGYVLSLVLYPEGYNRSDADTAGDTPRGIDGQERVVLSIAYSIVISTSVVLILHLLQFGVHLLSMLLALNLFIVISILLAAYRFTTIPKDRQFEPELGRWFAGVRAELSTFENIDRNLLIGLVVVVLLVGVGTVYTISNPGPSERYTELYLVHENESGALVANNYPTELREGSSTSFVVGVRNHEFETVRYTLVVKLQHTDERTASSSVIQERELSRIRVSLAHDESWQHPHKVTPDMAGEDLRLVYLLYRGSAPSDAKLNSAYREVHIWVDIKKADSPN